MQMNCPESISLSRPSPIDTASRSSPQIRDNVALSSKKRTASQIFCFVNDELDSAELVEVLSNPVFAAIGDNSPRTFASVRDGLGGLSSQLSPRLTHSPCLTSPTCSSFICNPVDAPSVPFNGGSVALSPAVFNRLSIASPNTTAPLSTSFLPVTPVSRGMLGPSLDACVDSVEISVGCDLLSPYNFSTDLSSHSNSAVTPNAFEESFDGIHSSRTHLSQAVTASHPATPSDFDTNDRSSFGCALIRSNSLSGELCLLTDEGNTPSPVLFLPARSMSVSTISSKLELHESRVAGGLSFLYFKRSRDGLNALTAQTLASMLRGGSNVDPPLLCDVSAMPSILRSGAACPLSQQLSVQAPRFTVIDARYDFEFSGGHIESAISINKTSDLTEYFFPEQNRAMREGTPIPPPPLPTEHVYVFHCEYSQKRGPELLNSLRELDRKFNEYPTLSFPHLYILDEGYKHFFETHSYCCDGGYIPMKNPAFKTDLAIAKKICCQKRAKVSSVRAARLPIPTVPQAQVGAAMRSNAFVACSGSFAKLPCE